MHPEIIDAVSWAYVMQGNDQFDKAQITEGPEADELFKQAGEKYAEALKIQSDKHEALNNWALVLDTRARRKVGLEAYELFKQASEKYAEAVKIQPDMHEAWNNWGLALHAQAQRKEGLEAEELFKQASEKYAEAVKIKPGDAEKLDNWGSTLVVWSRVVSDTMKGNLLIKAKDVLLQAEQIEKGSGSYNLACVYSLLGHDAECLKWLETSKEAGRLPKREHLDNDKDMDSVREKQWFKDFLATVE